MEQKTGKKLILPIWQVYELGANSIYGVNLIHFTYGVKSIHFKI